MKKLLLFVFAALAFAACTQNDIEELSANRQDVPETLTVGFEGADDDTRIQLNETQKTVWTKDDLVSVFYRSNANQKWQYQGETGERVGNLRRVADATATETMHRTVVVYPYNENYYINPETYNIDATLPSVQHYAEDSYGVGDNLMVSQSEFTQFTLKNVCGWLKIQLTGNGERVTSLTLKGNNDEQLAGLIYVDTTTAESTLASEMGSADDNNAGGNLVFDDSIITELTLDCGEGVELGEKATAFYFAVPPQTFENGVTVEVKCESYEPMTLTTTEVLTIERNHIKPMESVEHDAEPATPNNEIHYTATAKVEANSDYPWTFDTFGANIVSNEWNSESGKGVITFDTDVTTIGYAAFVYCKSLTSVTIPDSVTTIENATFYDCENLINITIPDSVTTIGGSAFYWCSSLTSVTIPDSVTTIGEWAFAHCDSLTSVTIPDSVTTIGDYVFYDCDSLTSVTIPDSVTTIGEWAFGDCSSLTSVTIGDSVTTIGYAAFAYCDSLTSITIPDSVTTIGEGAFYGCYSLTSVYCEAITPPSLGGSEVFDDNASGRKIYVPAASVEAYKTDYYWSRHDDDIIGIDFSTTSTINYTTSDGQIVNARLPIISNTYSNGIGTIEFWGSIIPVEAFYDCTSLTSITIPDSVTTIEEWALGHCDSLTSITIPDSVTTIGEGVFAFCDSLTSITIPDNVTTIGECAFYYCYSLTSVTIPDSVTTIGVAAFDSCSSLTSITIPDSVSTIEAYAFSNCSSLTSVYCEATTPPSLGGSYVFDDNALGRKIYVSTESVDAYKSATYWSEYADAIIGYDFEKGEVVE